MLRSDGQILNDINNKLLFFPWLKCDNLQISVHDRVVKLGGVVSNYSEKIGVEKTVKNIMGVRGVAAEIKVELAPRYIRTDVEITKAAFNALTCDVCVPAKAIKVAVNDGWITLSGNVEWQYQKLASETSLRFLFGVKGIFNQIMVKPCVTPPEVKKKIINEFKRNSLIDAGSIDVTVEGSKVTLKGRVRNWTEALEVTDAAWAAQGISHVNNKLTIRLRP